MVSKVDRTVDSCIIFKKIATVATSRQSIFRGSCLIDFSGKVASKSPSSYKMASKSQKKSVEVNSRLRGRSEILQQLTFLEKVDHTVDYGFKI
jgi:hypothetical protein